MATDRIESGYSAWKSIKSTFNIECTNQRTSHRKRKSINRRISSLRTRGKGATHAFQAEGSLKQLNVYVADSDCENAHQDQEDTSIPTNHPHRKLPLSNISNSPIKSHRQLQQVCIEEDESIDYDPDYSDDLCPCSYEPKPKRKSPIAVTSYTKKICSLKRSYSDDIFLEAGIDTQSQPVEIPETDSDSNSQTIKETEDLFIETDSTQQSVIEVPETISTACSSPVSTHISNEFYIDDTDSDDQSSQTHQKEVVNAASSVIALADTIVESQSSNGSMPKSLPLQQVNPKAKRPKAKKNGLLEQLNSAINKSKSKFAFWLHERRAGLIGSGTYFEVTEVDRTFGRCLVICRDVNEQLARPDISVALVGLLLDSELKLCANVRAGAVLEVDLSGVDEEMRVDVVGADGKPMLVYSCVQCVRLLQ